MKSKINHLKKNGQVIAVRRVTISMMMWEKTTKIRNRKKRDGSTNQGLTILSTLPRI
jgi:hypothetical protein